MGFESSAGTQASLAQSENAAPSKETIGVRVLATHETSPLKTGPVAPQRAAGTPVPVGQAGTHGLIV